MLTAEFLSRLNLHAIPTGQKLWAQFLRFNYALPPKTKLLIEGIENIPRDRQVFLAMNHTDRYNSWPLQFHIAQTRKEYTCTWVKGKYYINPVTRFFLLSTNNIPLASRGYVISSRFKAEIKRPPNSDEYRSIRDLMDQKLIDDSLINNSEELKRFLGNSPETKIKALVDDFAAMSNEVLRLNKQALELGHHILVFPQGTRSVHLTKGHMGLAQMAQRMGIDIVPIGCSGSDLCYPGTIPWARRGEITYRIGKPIRVNSPELSHLRVKDDFVPFSYQAQAQYSQRFQELTAIIMNRLNDLVDTPYQFGKEGNTLGVDRFL